MTKEEFDALVEMWWEGYAQLYQRMQDDLRLYLGERKERRSLMFGRFLCWLGLHIYLPRRVTSKTTILTTDGGNSVTET
jgi:hypothetical protein